MSMASRFRRLGLALGLCVIAACAVALPPPLPPETARDALLDPAASLWRERAPKRFYVRFETTKGSFVVEVNRKWAPLGADRFYRLVRAGFFDDSRFFRVRPRELAQFGIPGDPAIAEVWRNATIPDDPAKERNLRGTLAYAMSGPNTRTTQIFVNLRHHPQRDGEGFVPFGHIVAGQSVVDALYAGYGDLAGGSTRSGSQAPVFEGGNPHLDRLFPRLDKLISARLVASPEQAALSAPGSSS